MAAEDSKKKPKVKPRKKLAKPTGRPRQDLAKDIKADQKAAFLAALRTWPNATKAALTGGAHRDTFYEWRKKDPEFAEAWQEAVKMGNQALEDYAFEIARKIAEKSPVLLIFLLKGAFPEKYKDRVETKNEHKIISPLCIHIDRDKKKKDAGSD